MCYNLNNFRSEKLGRIEGERIFQRGGGNRIYDDKGKKGNRRIKWGRS